jgi:hypothetical protein
VTNALPFLSFALHLSIRGVLGTKLVIRNRQQVIYLFLCSWLSCLIPLLVAPVGIKLSAKMICQVLVGSGGGSSLDDPFTLWK